MNAQTPPQNLEAEESLLGSILLDPEAMTSAVSLPVEAFYRESHRLIFKAIGQLYSSGQPIELVTLTEQLRQNKQLDLVGGVPFLIGLADLPGTAAYADSYAQIIREKHRARQLIGLCGKTMQAAYDGELDAALLEHEQTLTTLSRFEALERGPADYYQGAIDTFDGIGGLTTGFPSLDAVSGGLVRAGYNVIAARPSMGKSSLARSILGHRASAGDHIALFSIDQSGDDIYALEAAKRVRVPITSFRRDKYGQQHASARDIQRAKESAEWLRDVWSATFAVHDSRAELGSIIAKAREEIRAGATIIAVDHIQSIMLEGKSDDTNVVSSVSRAFKALSREYNVTVLMLAQLNRSVESRDNKRPLLKDLRQSGAIEEDANQVVFLYRDDYYANLEKRPSEKPGTGELIVAKNKLGPVPETAELTWVGRFASFEEKAYSHQAPSQHYAN